MFEEEEVDKALNEGATLGTQRKNRNSGAGNRTLAVPTLSPLTSDVTSQSTSFSEHPGATS